MGKNSYKELKELSNDRGAWRTAANQSKGLKTEREKINIYL